MAMEPEKQPPATPPATGLDDKVEDDTTVEKQYPPTRKVIPAMLAVYLVFFLVALVRCTQSSTKIWPPILGKLLYLS